jgi:hypothetical protein
MPPRALAIEVATQGSVGSVKRVELELLLRQAQEVNRVFRYGWSKFRRTGPIISNFFS